MSRLSRLSRRSMVQGALAAGGLGLTAGAPRAQELPVTPQCDEAGPATMRQTEGPFFKPKSPERRSLLESGGQGEKLVLSGIVFSRACKPVANALLDFWHSDDMGEYDNEGFRFRGHQFSDAEGRFRLETIVPARYPGRTRHIHVKVQAPQKRILTTQIYFPSEPGNARDPINDTCVDTTADIGSIPLGAETWER